MSLKTERVGVWRECWECGGKGSTDKLYPCAPCSGQGRVEVAHGGVRPGAGRPRVLNSARNGGVRVVGIVTPEDAELVARARERSGLTTGQLLTLIAREVCK